MKNFQLDYTGEVDTYSEEDFPFEVEFVEKMARTHRTLQQTFSELVFRWLSKMEGAVDNELFVRISQTINKELDDYFYRTPMI